MINAGGNMKKSILLRVSEEIKKRMEEAARKENRSLTNYLVWLFLKEAIKNRQEETNGKN